MAGLCVRMLQRVLTDLTPFNDGRCISDSALDSLVFCLETAYRELLVLDLTEELSPDQMEGLEIVRSCLGIVRAMQRLSQSLVSRRSSRAVCTHTGAVGRPRYEIPESNLTFLLENRFTVPQIACMIGVSISTVRRRMTDLGLSVRALYSNTSDTELDDIVGDIHHQHPTCGNIQMQGHLLSRGYRIQQVRVRDSLRRIDPNGTALRRLTVMNRRQYSVPSPLSLFHMDGNHKLIR